MNLEFALNLLFSIAAILMPLAIFVMLLRGEGQPPSWILSIFAVVLMLYLPPMGVTIRQIFSDPALTGAHWVIATFKSPLTWWMLSAALFWVGLFFAHIIAIRRIGRKPNSISQP